MTKRVSPAHFGEHSLAEQAFGLLADDLDPQPDRSTFVQAFYAAQSAYPGPATTRWAKWILEAARSVRLRVKIIECSFEQIGELVRRGAHPISFDPQGHLTSLARWSRGHFLVLDHGKEVRLSPRSLAQKLGYTDVDDVIRWVVLEHLPATDHHADVHSGGHGSEAHHGHHHLPPLPRLFRILRAERSDIWVVIVFALFAAVLALAVPIAVQALVDTVAFGRYLQPVIVLSILLLTFLVFGATMRGLQMFVVEIIQRRIFARVISDLAYRLPRVRHDRDDGEYLPEVVNRFFAVMTTQKAVAILLLDGLALVVAMFVGMAVLAVYDPWLLGFDIVLIGLMAFTVFGLGRGAVRTSIRESLIKFETASWIEDIARCRTSFALGGAGDFAAHHLDKLTTEYLKARKSHFAILMRQVGFALALQAVASTVLLGLGGWLVISNQLSLGQLVAAELIVAIIVGAFAKLDKHMETYYDLLAAVDKLGHMFDLPMEEEDGLLSLPETGAARLRCRELSCTFPGQSSLFTRFNLDVAPGEAIAILAPAGAGKTTLAEVLFAMRRPTEGFVEFDGVDPRDVRPDVYRTHVAFAGRLEFVHGTIMENITLDRPHVSSTEVRETLRAMGLLEHLLSLPDGLKTKLTPDGAPLSESQSRRIVLARALAGHPRLLIVDGLLDFLDARTLDLIIPVILNPTRTTIVLTARPELAEHFQRVIELGAPERPTTFAGTSRFNYDQSLDSEGQS